MADSDGKAEPEDITLIGLILFVACGLLVLIVGIILSKRQIMRFALKSKTGQHIPICYDISRLSSATLCLQKMKIETKRRLHRTQGICHEPRLLHNEANKHMLTADDYCGIPHLYRMKALNLCKHLELQITKNRDFSRTSAEPFDVFLRNNSNLLSRKIGQGHIDELCILYRHARHEPKLFGKIQYNKTQAIVTEISNIVQGGQASQLQAFRPIADISELPDEVLIPKASSSQFNLPIKRTVINLANKMFTSKKKKQEYQSVPSTESLDEIDETTRL